MFVLQDNQLIKQENIYTPVNSSLWLGDGFFETLRIKGGVCPLIQLHWERMVYSSRELAMPLCFADRVIFERYIRQLIDANQVYDARIRIHFYRDMLQGYTVKQDSTHYLMSSTPLPHSENNDLSLVSYDVNTKALQPLSNIKLISAQLYTLADAYARHKNADDALVFNTQGRPIETSRSNIFWLKDHTWYTPPLHEGCVAGVMRAYLIKTMQEKKLSVIEMPADRMTLKNADALITTNAVRGIMRVSELDKNVFKDTEHVEELKQLIA